MYYSKYTTDTKDVQYNVEARNRDNFNYDTSSTGESERSYAPLFTSDEIMECLLLANYKVKWHFYTLLATNVMYFILTYAIVFDRTFDHDSFVYLAKVICNIILLADSLITIYHHFSKNTKKEAYGKIDRGLLATQIMFLLIFPLQFAKYQKIWTGDEIDYLLISVYLLKYYKLFIYLRLVQNMPMENTYEKLYMKYFIIIFFEIHTLTIVWMLLGCFEDKVICQRKYKGDASYWNDDWFIVSLREGGLYAGFTPWRYYMICLYYIMGAFTTTGYVGSSSRNDAEDIVLIVAMILFLFNIYGFFGAELICLRMETNVFLYQNLFRKQAITYDLHSFILRKHKHAMKVLDYYEQFWDINSATKTAEMMQVIPKCLADDVMLEISWVFLRKCYLLKRTSNSFQRAIAATIKVDMLPRSTVIYNLGSICNEVYYIARGAVEILSCEDGSSPLATLGKGTCLGQIHLMQRTVTKYKVVVAMYSVVFRLNKKDFWMEVYKYRKLKQKAQIYRNYREKMALTREAEAKKEPIQIDSIFRKWRCVVAKKILSTLKESAKYNQLAYAKFGATLHEDPKKLYLFVQAHNFKTYDEVFLHTKFPWILQQNSQFFVVWNYIVLFVVIYVSLWYPYQVAFLREFQLVTTYLVTAVFGLDAVMQLFTAIETKLGVAQTVDDIFMIRLGSTKFILDVLAAIPLNYFYYATTDKELVRVVLVCNMNQLLKIYKIHDEYVKLRNNENMNMVLLGCLKNLVYILYIGYVFCCFHYIFACLEPGHCEHFWIDVLYNMTMKLGEELDSRNISYTVIDIRETPMVLSFLGMMFMLTLSHGLPVIRMVDMFIQVCISMFGFWLLSVTTATFAMALALSNRAAVKYMEFLTTTKSYMDVNQVREDIKIRVIAFLENNWIVHKATTGHIYDDCPEQLFKRMQIMRFKRYVLPMDMFTNAGVEIQDMVASRCKEIHFPPNEYLVYSGQNCMYFYSIIQGCCQIVEGLSRRNMLFPGNTINVVEIFTGLPCLLTVRTETHCRLLAFSVEDVDYLRKVYPDFMTDVLDSVDLLAVDRVYARVGEAKGTVYFEEVDKTEKVPSFFVFPTQKRNPLKIDYEVGFGEGKWRLIKYIMMRFTVIPNGSFYIKWEIFRAVCAFILSIMSPAYFIVHVYFPQVTIILYLLHAIAFIDICIKFHLCYYNKFGVLVTHPMYTASNYVTHSFAVDAISAFPLKWLASFFGYAKSIRLQLILHVNVVLQMYRFPNIFVSTKRYIHRNDGVFMTMLKTIPFILVLINTLTCVIFAISAHDVKVNGYPTLTMGRNTTWFTGTGILAHRLKFGEPGTIYLSIVYIISITMVGNVFNLVHPHTVPENIFFIICLVSGYALKTCISIIVASNRFNIAHKMTEHTKHMNQLEKYMRDEKIPKDLQTTIFKHFDHIWHETSGVSPKEIYGCLHVPLRMDFLTYLYSETFTYVPVFEEASSMFYRHLGLIVNEFHLLENSRIIKVNDIIDKIAIIHKGEAIVHGPDGSIFATLRRGSMFGNLDNASSTRSMIMVTTTTVCVLLVFDTQKLYDMLKDYEHLFYKLQHYLLLENLCYVEGSYKNTSEGEVEPIEKPNEGRRRIAFGKFLINRAHSLYFIFFDIFVSASSGWLVSYQLAFAYQGVLMYWLLFFDVAFLFTTVVNVTTPYYDENGLLVLNYRKVLKHNLKSIFNILNVMTVPPYDLIPLAFDNAWYVKRHLGLYRLIRLVKVHSALNGLLYTFGMKLILVRLVKMAIYIAFLLHTTACLWYYVSCPSTFCQSTSWTHSLTGENVCGSKYLCSVYLAVSVASTTGFANRTPIMGTADMALCAMIGISMSYFLGIVLGDSVVMYRIMQFGLSDYNHDLRNFQTYLKNGYVSPPFINKMLEYCISLWTVRGGRQVPHYLTVMPKDLLERLKARAYGEHIFMNMLFERCHPDFLRGIIRKLKVNHFIAGDVICEQDVINDTMYFVHRGKVNVYTVTETEEIHVDELSEMDNFGIVQGLFPHTPHTHRFAAATLCSILMLNYYDIKFLLHFFPASKFEIYSIANMLFLDKRTTRKFYKYVQQRPSGKNIISTESDESTRNMHIRDLSDD